MVFVVTLELYSTNHRVVGLASAIVLSSIGGECVVELSNIPADTPVFIETLIFFLEFAQSVLSSSNVNRKRTESVSAATTTMLTCDLKVASNTGVISLAFLDKRALPPFR